MPPTLSSTTVASSACSACTASRAGWIELENLRPATFTRGSGASAITASSGSVVTRMIVTTVIIARFDRVIGIITTNIWIWLRSLDDRLINWPVWARSWKPMWSDMMWPKSRSRRRVSVHRASVNA